MAASSLETSQWPRRLRRRGGDAIVGVMRARPPPQQASDLFTAAADAKAVAPPETAGVAANPAVEKVGQPSPPRHLLPKDLPRALARLDDGEIDALLAAVVEEAKRRDRVPASLLAQRPEAPAPPRCVTLERGGDTSNSGFRAGRRNFVDARSGECRSRGVQGRCQGVHDRATIRAIAVRGAKGACLGDAGAQTLSLVPRSGTARLRRMYHIMCDAKRVTPPTLSLRLCLRRQCGDHTSPLGEPNALTRCALMSSCAAASIRPR